MIIGITKTLYSGGDEVVDYLEYKGFARIDMSNFIRAEMKFHGLGINRKSMQDFGDVVRLREGKEILAKRAIKLIEPEKNYAVEGIKNPAEVNELRKIEGFCLIGVDSETKNRFGRIKKFSKYEDEPNKINEFIEWEKRDLGMRQPIHGQQQLKCMKMADFVIKNDSTLDELQKKVDEILAKLKK